MRLFLSLLLATASLLRAEDAAQWLRQGDALDKQLRTQEALSAYQQADLAQPGQAETLCLIAREQSLLMSEVTKEADKRQRGEIALETAKRAAALDPNSTHVHLVLAVCYGRLAPVMDNRTKIAYSKLVREHVDQVLRPEPNNDLALHVLGAWNYELANLSFVLRAVATALYGKLPAASNEEAARCLFKAIALNPTRIGNHYVLGKVLLAEGEKSRARDEWQKALDLPSREKDDEILKQKVRDLMKKL